MPNYSNTVFQLNPVSNSAQHKLEYNKEGTISAIEHRLNQSCSWGEGRDTYAEFNKGN